MKSLKTSVLEVFRKWWYILEGPSEKFYAYQTRSHGGFYYEAGFTLNYFRLTRNRIVCISVWKDRYRNRKLPILSQYSYWPDSTTDQDVYIRRVIDIEIASYTALTTLVSTLLKYLEISRYFNLKNWNSIDAKKRLGHYQNARKQSSGKSKTEKSYWTSVGTFRTTTENIFDSLADFYSVSEVCSLFLELLW